MATLSTQRFLENIVHPDLYKTISKFDSHKDDGVFLESFLNDLKRSLVDGGDPVLQEIALRLNSLIGDDLFIYTGNSADSGKKLEQDFEALMLSMASVLSSQVANQFFYGNQAIANINQIKQTYNLGGIGKLGAVININVNGQKMPINYYKQQLMNKAKMHMGNYDAYMHSLYIEKFGKIDFDGNNFNINMNIDYYASQRVLRAFNILKNAKISLKNSKNLRQIKLGQTNPFKMFVSVISAVTSLSYNQIYAQYCRMRNCYDFHRQEHGQMVEKHLGHIYSVYELIGLGLIDSAGNSQVVDYLIVNDSTSAHGRIKVLTTKEIVHDYVGNNSNIFHDNRYLKSSGIFNKNKIKLSIKQFN